MASRRKARMFHVVVLAGVSLAACGSESSTGQQTGVPGPITNPPAPTDGSATDSPAGDGGVDAPTDARDEMPIIK